MCERRAEGTFARKCSNKLGISLAYSYFDFAEGTQHSAKQRKMMFFFALLSFFPLTSSKVLSLGYKNE